MYLASFLMICNLLTPIACHGNDGLDEVDFIHQQRPKLLHQSEAFARLMPVDAPCDPLSCYCPVDPNDPWSQRCCGY